ncbi:MAG: hypothetical protein PVS2B3_05290 [Steroidobacteraceae bacterium]
MSARKQPQELPKSPGVYQIGCKRNGNIYVGSAVNLRERWRGHYRDLCNRVHHNSHLQSAWNRHGEAAFEFVVLECVAAPQLLIAEQQWIERTGCTDHRIGFKSGCRQQAPATELDRRG